VSRLASSGTAMAVAANAAPVPPGRATRKGTDESMASVPAVVRNQIVSGMRWTIWLSAVAAPFTYATDILLARTSPETIGAYGLLMVYVALVSTVFYLGGDPVTIKFLPELSRAEQPGFLASYFLVICLGMVPWLAAAMAWPSGLRYLFGRDGSGEFFVFVLCLSPLPILYSLVLAAIKARLDLRLAQALTRTVTLGSFLIYAALYLACRAWLERSPIAIVWSVYLGLTTLAAGIGLCCLRASPQRSRFRIRPRLVLPAGFWKYMLGTQQASLLGFFLQRLDYVLIVNFGGLKLLGEYVAITTLALTIPLINRFFFDTLLPSLTNLLAAGNLSGAAEVFRVHMRIVFVATAAATCGLVLLASPLTALFGVPYKNLASCVLLLSLLIGLASPGAAGGTLLSSIGMPQRTAWVRLFQVFAYAGLFFFLWPRYRLLGAVVALGVSTLVCHALLYIIATRSVPFPARIGGEYAKFGLVSILAALVSWRWVFNNPPWALAAWVTSVLAFLAAGTYSPAECRWFWRCFVPNPFAWRRQSGHCCRSCVQGANEVV
jgi:O-antigen/teichoic acid export membrane protein